MLSRYLFELFFEILYTEVIKLLLNLEENKDDIDQMRNLQDYEKKILRHEIIHAFLYESGLDINSHDIDQWARDEEMVDWMAIQFP